MDKEEAAAILGFLIFMVIGWLLFRPFLFLFFVFGLMCLTIIHKRRKKQLKRVDENGRI